MQEEKIKKAGEKLYDAGRKTAKSRDKIISLYRQTNENMTSELEKAVARYRKLGIEQQIDYDKFYLYSLITHSTAIEGSTITELENQIMFDQGISIQGKSIEEQNMNIDLKRAYEKAIELVKLHTSVTTKLLIELSASVMKNTGREYRTALGNFSSAKGGIAQIECYGRYRRMIIYGLQ